MFELDKLSQWVQEKLNHGLYLHMQDKEDTLLKGDRYEFAFRVYTDIGEHKGWDYLDLNGNVSQTPTNKIRRYIEAEMIQIDSTVEASDYVNVVRNTELTILVPLNDIDLIGDRNTVVEEIREVIENTFKQNLSVAHIDDNYDELFSVKCSLASSGDRNTRSLVGDSVTLTAYLNFYYVENGLFSYQIAINIDGTPIHPIRMGISRVLTQETNTFSNDTRAVAMNTPTSSVFTINFDAVCRTSPIFYEMYRYAMKGKTLDKDENLKPKVSHCVEILYSPTESTYKLMNFDSINISTQNPLIASMSVVMSETKYLPGLTNISAYASEHLQEILAEQE